MSDEHAHDDGAHEIDKMPAGRLFTILAVLGSLTLALCIGVIQLFNQQVRSIENGWASDGYASQADYLTEMSSVADGYGKYEIVKPGGEGKPDEVTTRYFIPIKDAEKKVLEDASLLQGKRPPRAWGNTGTGKKVEEWGGYPKATPRKPGPKPGDAKEAAKAKSPREHRFAFTINAEDLVLLGEVPSDDVSKSIEAAAKKTRFGDKVRNKLKVTNAPGKPGFDTAYTRAIAVVDLLSSGTTKFTAGKLSVDGFVPDEKKAAFEALMASANGPTMGAVEVASTEAADKCDERFAKTLRSPIRFETGSADISPKSDKLLDKLAGIAKECPGKFVIEGHSDNQGNPNANKQLSLSRANSVSAALQDKGVEKKRLRAKGFGQERPVASNDDEAGRKKNRRIEIHIAR